MSLAFGDRPSAPWFGLHRGWATAAAAVLFSVVFIVRLVISGVEEPVSLFYVLPIALVAMAWGLRGGLVSAGAGIALVGVWTVIDDVTLTPLGWAIRVLSLGLLGILVGLAADGLEEARRTERELVATQQREREAAEINDSIIQGLVAAKWLLESGDEERSLAYLTESIERTQALVGDLLRQGPLTPGMFRRRTEVEPYEAR
jgi:hypothetical protein